MVRIGQRWQWAITLGTATAIATWGGVAAAIEPGEYEGSLDGSEPTLSDGSFYDVVELELSAGESVSITLDSDEFDTYLILIDEENNEVVHNNDGNGANAQILETASQTATYRIIATSYIPSATGAYRLIWRPASINEVEKFKKRQTADQLLQQGIRQRRASQFREAIQSWEQSLAIYQEIDDAQGEAASLGNLGIVYGSLGQYERAIGLLQQQLIISRRFGDRQGEAASLGNLGIAYGALGQYEQAINVQQQSLEIEQSNENRRGEATSLGSLGNTYYSLGKYEQAIDFIQQQLIISQEIHDEQGEANALGNLGLAYDALGQYERAIELHQKSLNIARNIGDRQGEAASLGNLGIAYDALGQHDYAISFYQQQLGILRNIGDQSGEAAALGNLGIAYDALGQYDYAISFYQQQLEITRNLGLREGEANSLGNLGIAYDALGEHEQALHFLQQQLAIMRKIDNIQGEAISLNNLGAVYAVMDDVDEAEIALRQSLEAYNTMRQDLGDNDTNKISFFEEQLRVYRNLQRVLARADRAEAALEIADRARARSLAEFLAEDQPDTPTSLDLDDIRQVARQQNATAIVYSDLGGNLFTWVIRPNGTITLRTEQSPDATLRDTMLQARSSATNPNAGGRGATIAAVARRVEENDETGLGDAYQRLIAPIADLLPTEPAARLIIVPDRELGLIPWVALRDPASDRRLIDRYTLTLAPSLYTLRETHRRRQNLPPGGPPLIVGNPAPMPNGLAPLPHAEREAIAIAQRHNLTPLIGAAATETAVKQTWQTARWLHFATHGDPTWIALSRDRTNDGLLTIEEIFNSQLQAELVVMSACDTGQGSVTGEGIIGLARAFLRAGVPSVVATLWKVPDDATAFLMDIFYRELAAGASKAAALRTAQLETRAQPQYAHPRNWAAFVLIGEAN